MELRVQVAGVTRTSGGIGRAIGQRLSLHRAAVALGYPARPEPAEALAANITAARDHAITIEADLADPHGPERLIHEAETRLGPIECSRATPASPYRSSSSRSASPIGLDTAIPVRHARA